MRFRWKIGPCILAALAMASIAMAAEVQMRQEPVAAAAPTQPVVSNSLEAPAYDSDTRHIQAIVDRDDDVNNEKPVVTPATPLPVQSATITATPVATPVANAPPVARATPVAVPVANAPPVPVPVARTTPVAAPVTSAVAVATPVVTVNTPEKTDAPTSGLITAMRAFATRWHDVFDMVFTAAAVAVALLMYRHSQIQTKILAASVRAAEDAARAAQTSARLAQEHAAQLNYDDRGRESFDL